MHSVCLGSPYRTKFFVVCHDFEWQKRAIALPNAISVQRNDEVLTEDCKNIRESQRKGEWDFMENIKEFFPEILVATLFRIFIKNHILIFNGFD